MLLSFIEQEKAVIKIEDEHEAFLYGDINAPVSYSYPVKLEDEILGWVKGDEKSMFVASLLSLLAEKDLEKKKLGSEVLALYQEVNMVFNFSDKLAQAIEPTAIAQITLEEAMHLIHSNSGLVTFCQENSKQ